jgi:hypothetical protein
MLGVSFIPATGSVKSSSELANSSATENFANLVTNMKLSVADEASGGGGETPGAQSTLSAANENTKSQQIISITSGINLTQLKSKFKTIKIFVASNKDGKCFWSLNAHKRYLFDKI